jgi:hypothetical protein
VAFGPLGGFWLFVGLSCVGAGVSDGDGTPVPEGAVRVGWEVVVGTWPFVAGDGFAVGWGVTFVAARLRSRLGDVFFSVVRLLLGIRTTDGGEVPRSTSA